MYLNRKYGNTFLSIILENLKILLTYPKLKSCFVKILEDIVQYNNTHFDLNYLNITHTLIFLEKNKSELVFKFASFFENL